MRGDLSGDPTFEELIARTRATALEAYAHADVPFDHLVAALRLPRDLSRTPVFQAMFQLNDAVAELELDGLAVTPFELNHRSAPQTRLSAFGVTPTLRHEPPGAANARWKARSASRFRS